MRKLLLLFLIFSVITSTGFSQTIDYKKVLLPAQANNKTKTHQLFKAPLGSTHSVYTPSFIKADQERLLLQEQLQQIHSQCQKNLLMELFIVFIQT